MITSDKSHSSFVTIAKKVSESIVISSYEQNKATYKIFDWILVRITKTLLKL